MLKVTSAAFLSLSMCLLAAGCGSDSSETGSRSGGATVQASWMLSEAPESWLDVGQIKPTAEAGEQVVIRGRIGGRIDPISSGSPSFVIMDMNVPSCADDDDDHCKTPWDYCCTPREVIAANNATVIVLDADGTHTTVNLVGAGLSPMDEVIVVGTVDARPNEQVLTIRATGVHRVNRAG